MTPQRIDGRIAAASVVGKCTACRLHETRRRIVYGRGEIPAHLLFVGEAPGVTEDVSGIACYGKSGALFDAMIAHAVDMAEIGARHLRTFITNTVLCHPTDEKGGSNRQPANDEVLACMRNVRCIHDIVQPRMVVFIGKIAQKHYGKLFKPSAVIVHPLSLLLQGGTAAPGYLTTTRNLSVIIKAVMQ
jgi:uracil-DNA glycosylase